MEDDYDYDNEESIDFRAGNTSFGGRWSKCEDDRLRRAIESTSSCDSKKTDWHLIANRVFNGDRTVPQCQSRWEKVIKPGLVKGPWTPLEDEVKNINVCYIYIVELYPFFSFQNAILYIL